MWKNGMRPVVIGRMPFLCCGNFFAGWSEENVNNSVELRRRRRSPEKSGKPQNVLRRGPAHRKTYITLPSPPGKLALTEGGGSAPLSACKFHR